MKVCLYTITGVKTVQVYSLKSPLVVNIYNKVVEVVVILLLPILVELFKFVV